LAQVAIDETESFFYSGYYERKNFEILRASLEPPIELESFFRTNQDARNNECGMLCCDVVGDGVGQGGHTYFEVQPRDYVLDGADVFVSWDGFYQDCDDYFASKRNLQWSIGVSKIRQTPECVLNGGLDPVNFQDCSTPVSIFHEEGTAKNMLLGYSGIAVSLSPSGKRVFYLSVINNSITSLDGAGGSPVNEIWTMPEGEHYMKNPNALQKFGGTAIAKPFLDYSVDDVGTIRLRLDENRIPTALCRTAYDAGVFCYALLMKDEENIEVTSTKTFVTVDQLAQSCTIESEHYPISMRIPPVSTGLEVLWRDDSPDDLPAMLFFGCLGEVNAHGNFTTAFADGTITQTVSGGYPGTILFGKDVSSAFPEMGDSFSPDFLPPAPVANHRSSQLSSFFVLVTLAVGLFTGRKYLSQRQETRYYELILQAEAYAHAMTPPTSSTTAYVELAAAP
jgi:hypothetical protein